MFRLSYGQYLTQKQLLHLNRSKTVTANRTRPKCYCEPSTSQEPSHAVQNDCTQNDINYQDSDYSDWKAYQNVESKKPAKGPKNPYYVKPVTKATAALQLRFSTSSGPGGQNVNKVCTRVEACLDLNQTEEWLSNQVKQKLMQSYASYISKKGILTVTSQLTRSQQRNIEDALKKLNRMLVNSAKAAKPKTVSKAKAKRISSLKKKYNAKRLQDKKRASKKKRDRKIHWKSNF